MNKVLTFKEQLKTLSLEDLAKIKHTINTSSNLQCINSLSKKLLLTTLSDEIQAKQGGRK